MMGFRRRVTVEGLNLSRFVRRAGDEGVCLTCMRRTGGRRLTAVIEASATAKLAQIAQEGGWQLTMGQPVGAGKLCTGLKRRWTMLALMSTALLLWGLSGQVMWRISLEGAEAYEADVWKAIAEAGVRSPMLRRDVDADALRDALEWRYPDVTWVECGWRGMTLHIRFVQGVSGAPDADGAGACDVVAARDGVIANIVTRAGTPVVAPGDMVREGDVLIRGVERTSGGQERRVAARGSVYACVWETAAVQTPLTMTQTTPTGREMRDQHVICPWFMLWRETASSYMHEDVHRKEIPLGGIFWPLKLRYETHIETDSGSVMTDYRSVLDENNHAALQKLIAQVGGKESLVDNWVNWSIIEDEILLSVATGERVVDIARQERSSGMAATE